MTGAERLDEFEQVSMREAPDTSSITRVSEVRPRTQYLGRAHTAEENEKKRDDYVSFGLSKALWWPAFCDASLGWAERRRANFCQIL